jgi:glycosyltransferase involved in cell wall biosynthesis
VKPKPKTQRSAEPQSTRAPIKILHCLGTLDPGGVETWLLHLLKSLDTKQVQFDFCTFGSHVGLYAPQVEKLGATVFRCPRSQNLWKFGRSFRKILREGHYDVVHSHVHGFSGVLLRWARLEGVPVRIAHSHNSHDGKSSTLGRRAYRSLMKRSIYRHKTHGLAASREAADDIFLDWKKDFRVAILHCGIDLQDFRGAINAEEWRAKLNLPIEAQVIGYVANFVPAKNHGFFLEIAAHIRKRRPDTHFLLIGDGPCRADIEARAQKMGLHENIHFLGTRTDVPMLLRTCINAFVFPSSWEGLPIAVIEAQAAGLPCIISSSITKEVAILQHQLVQLPLSSGAEKWASTSLESLDRGRFEADSSSKAMQRTDFTIEHGLSLLVDIYSASTPKVEDYVANS